MESDVRGKLLRGSADSRQASDMLRCRFEILRSRVHELEQESALRSKELQDERDAHADTLQKLNDALEEERRNAKNGCEQLRADLETSRRQLGVAREKYTATERECAAIVKDLTIQLRDRDTSLQESREQLCEYQEKLRQHELPDEGRDVDGPGDAAYMLSEVRALRQQVTRLQRESAVLVAQLDTSRQACRGKDLEMRLARDLELQHAERAQQQSKRVEEALRGAVDLRSLAESQTKELRAVLDEVNSRSTRPPVQYSQQDLDQTQRLLNLREKQLARAQDQLRVQLAHRTALQNFLLGAISDVRAHLSPAVSSPVGGADLSSVQAQVEEWQTFSQSEKELVLCFLFAALKSKRHRGFKTI